MQETETTPGILNRKGFNMKNWVFYKSHWMGCRNRVGPLSILGFKDTAMQLQSKCEKNCAPTTTLHAGSWYPGSEAWGLPEPLPVITTTRRTISAFLLLSRFPARASHWYNLNHFQNLAARESETWCDCDWAGEGRHVE